jgi:hypothetical protein
LTEDFGRLGEVQPIYDAANEKFPDNPDKARLYGDATAKLRANPAYHAARGIRRHEMVNDVMDNDYVRDVMTPGERVKFRHDMTTGDWVDKPVAEEFEAESAEGFWENLANEGTRGVRQRQLAWNASVEMALNNLIGADEDTVLEDVRDIAESYERLNKIPLSEAAKHVYAGDSTPAEYASWLAQTTTSSFVALAPFLPAITAAGLAGPVGTALASGISSSILEYGPTIIDYIAEEGVDVTNPDEILKAFTNEELMDDARSYAAKRTIPIGVVDGLSALVVGRVGAAKGEVVRAAKRAGVRPPANWWQKAGVTALDVGAGGYGEMLSQQWADGSITDWNGVIAEMAGELPTTIAEYAGGRVSAAREAGLTGLGDIGSDVAAGLQEGVGGFADTAPAPTRFIGAGSVTVDEELDEDSLTAGLEEGHKEYFDALPDEEKEKIYNDGNEEFGRRMAVKMDEYELTPDEIDRFPDQEREQIKREAFADVLEKHKDETAAQEEAEKPPEPQKQPSKPAEPEARTPAPAAPVAAEPAVAPRMLTLKEMKAMLREATTPEEIDVLEREWNERGNPRSTNGPKAIAAARERVGLEQVAPDEEIGVLKATGSMSVSEAREGEPVRYTTEDGKVVEGVVRFQEDSDQVGIQDTGGQFTYVPSESVVETFRGPKPEPKPKRKAKRKAKPKLAKEVKPVPFDTKANYVDTETGEPVIAERMMNGRWIVERKDGTLEQTGEVELPDRYQRPGEELEPVTTEVVEEVVEEEVVPEPEPVVEPEPEPEETVEDILKKSEREVAGVKIPVNEKSFAPNAKKMKDAVRAATTEAELDEIQVIENNAIEDGYTKFRPSVQTAIDNKRAEFTGRPSPQQLAKERDKESKRILEEREAKEEAAPEPVKPRPKKKRKALGDKVVEAEKEAEAKAKPKPKKTKKKAQAPVDPAKEVKPKSTKKKTKTDARQDDPKLTKDKAGATKANDLINIINNTDNVEVVKQAWRVYTADVKHGRRKRRSPNVEKSYNNRLDELAGEKFKEDARPVPSAKPEPKPQPKETEDQAAERMERDMNAEWPTEAYEDVEYEEQYAYFADLDDARLIDEMYNEITHRWFMTNGIRDYIDPHFVQQVVNEMAKVNPDAAHAADDV